MFSLILKKLKSHPYRGLELDIDRLSTSSLQPGHGDAARLFLTPIPRSRRAAAPQVLDGAEGPAARGLGARARRGGGGCRGPHGRRAREAGVTGGWPFHWELNNIMQ
jgi:hypothetical protein